MDITIRKGNFSLQGTVAFSYQVCLVAWDEKTQTLYFNDRKYSKTTTGHQDMAWSAFSHDLRPYAILQDPDVPDTETLTAPALIDLGRALLERNPGARIVSDEASSQEGQV